MNWLSWVRRPEIVVPFMGTMLAILLTNVSLNLSIGRVDTRLIHVETVLLDLVSRVVKLETNQSHYRLIHLEHLTGKLAANPFTSGTIKALDQSQRRLTIRDAHGAAVEFLIASDARATAYCAAEPTPIPINTLRPGEEVGVGFTAPHPGQKIIQSVALFRCPPK